MKNPNGYGGITKLSGNRRKPFRVRITKGWEQAENGKIKQLFQTLGYFSSRKEAMLALAEYNANPYDLANRKITFAECYNGWSVQHYKEYTAAAAGLKSAYKLCAPIAETCLADIRLKHLQDIMDGIADKSVGSQTKLKTIFLKTFEFASKNDIITKDYSKFVKISQTPIKQDINNKFFTSEEMKAVFDNINWSVEYPTGKKSYSEIKLVDSVIMLLYTGCRISELLAVKKSDINIEQRLIHVRGTKGENADRIVPIHKELLQYVIKRLETTEEYLLENANGKPFVYDRYKKSFFDPFMNFIGSKHTPHATRHTFISKMDSCGIPANSVTLKRIVGHANGSVTEHYTHKETAELIAAIDKLKLFS